MLAYFYPALLSLIPAFNLFIHNRVPIQYAWPSWIVILLIMVLGTYLIKIRTKDARKAGVIAAIFSAVFFYFEPFLQQLDQVGTNLGLFDRYRLLYSTNLPLLILLIWVLLWVTAARYILRSESITKKMNNFLIVVSLGLLVMPVVKISQILIARNRVERSLGETLQNSDLYSSPEMLSSRESEIEHQPDIIYLIFDAFAGEDILNSTYDMDISDFLDQLEERGFYVSAGSKTNYSQTINSLPSSLNMNYLEGLSNSVIDPHSWAPLAEALQQNQVSLFLDERGYELITFSSGFWPTENIRTDKKYQPAINLNEYQEVLFLNTPLVHIFPDFLYDVHRDRIGYTLSSLPTASVAGEPRFMFAHLYIPHPPFVFDEAGNPIHVPRLFSKYDADGYRNKGGTTSEYQEMYPAQLSYLLDRILILIDEIFAESESPPILILQGDHGPGSVITQHELEIDNLDERFSIMNAYYFPNQDYGNLYPGITPVNTFRVVFDQFYGTDLGLLADRNYFSTVFEPYNYFEMTEMLK